MKLSEKLYAPLALSPAQETRKYFTGMKRGPRNHLKVRGEKTELVSLP